MKSLVLKGKISEVIETLKVLEKVKGTISEVIDILKELEKRYCND